MLSALNQAREALNALLQTRQERLAQLRAEVAALQAVAARPARPTPDDVINLMLVVYLDTRSARITAELLNAWGLKASDAGVARPFTAADVCEVVLWPAVEGDTVLRPMAQAALQA